MEPFLFPDELEGYVQDGVCLAVALRGLLSINQKGCQRLAQCSLAYCPDVVKMMITEFGEIWGQKYRKFIHPFS